MQSTEQVVDDREIIDMYLARNEDAIERTSEKYGKYCSRIAYNILADLFETEECVNDTWMRTWNSIPLLRRHVAKARRKNSRITGRAVRVCGRERPRRGARDP